MEGGNICPLLLTWWHLDFFSDNRACFVGIPLSTEDQLRHWILWTEQLWTLEHSIQNQISPDIINPKYVSTIYRLKICFFLYMREKGKREREGDREREGERKSLLLESLLPHIKLFILHWIPALNSLELLTCWMYEWNSCIIQDFLQTKQVNLTVEGIQRKPSLE